MTAPKIDYFTPAEAVACVAQEASFRRALYLTASREPQGSFDAGEILGDVGLVLHSEGMTYEVAMAQAQLAFTAYMALRLGK